MGAGDCEALPTGDRAGLPTGHRSHLGTFHVRFAVAVAVGKTLTVNVFRQKMNQLFQGCGDIWRGIAKRSLWEIALSDYPPVPSQGKILNVLRGAYLGTFPGILLKGKLEHTEGRSHCTPYGTSLSSRDVSCSVPVRENIDGKRFPSKDKSVISRG
ncbi:hypothetical protein [Cylindrospermopsis raciborskii]|nr:hypothetical protein [Cylindrospermopsis raciborskii]